MDNEAQIYDLLVIGGGINGCGIARDAAGRGLSVLLAEQGDLAQATSSASTKLIHGGLRYLEQYDFKLVREALNEREVLLRSAPHIIWPLEFILPHDPYLRPRWMIRLGLYLYDFLGKRDILPASKGIGFRESEDKARALKESYKAGFSYADCWADDARLVTLCAMDAKERGADIRTRTKCVKLERRECGEIWNVTLQDGAREYEVKAKCALNAAGPWVRALLDENNLAKSETLHIRWSKGSHIIIPKLYDGDHAYILQQPDKRIVFAIPYEGEFTLIGTTDVNVGKDDLADVQIDEDEIEYLCAAASRSFKNPVTPEMIRWSYSGVRGLLDSGDDSLSEVTRDYKLDLELGHGAPLLNIFGGKLTAFRKLSEQAVDIVCEALQHNHAPWTKGASLPGGDIAGADFDLFLAKQMHRYPFIDGALLRRYARAYGTRMDDFLKGVAAMGDLGAHYGEGIYAAEIAYVVRAEWVRSAEDFLWRRSKLGLHVSEETAAAVSAAIDEIEKGLRDE